MRRFILALGPLPVPGAGARAQDDAAFGLTPGDVQRLQQRPQSLLSAMEQARGGEPADLVMLRRLMAAKPLPIGDARAIAGIRHCRVIKVGGLLPLTPYGFFKRRVTGRGDRARLAKISGSPRTSGNLLRLDTTTFLHRGVGYTDDAPRHPYGEVEKNGEVGPLFRVGRNHLRLELPAPHHESTYNVMEFVRRR